LLIKKNKIERDENYPVLFYIQLIYLCLFVCDLNLIVVWKNDSGNQRSLSITMLWGCINLFSQPIGVLCVA